MLGTNATNAAVTTVGLERIADLVASSSVSSASRLTSRRGCNLRRRSHPSRSESDHDLLGWVTGQFPTPEAHAPLVARIRAASVARAG